MAQLKSGSTIGGTGVLLNEANSVTASNITDGVVTAAKLAGAGTAGQVLTSTGGSTAPSMQDLSVDSSSLSSDFTVETGKTVTAGDVVNYVSGKIGNNPVANSLTTAAEDSTYSYSWVLPSGKVVVRSEGSDVRTGTISTTDGTINWNTAVTVLGTSGGGISHLGGNRFSVSLNGATSGGSWSPRSMTSRIKFFTVNEVNGTVSQSNEYSNSYSSWNYGYTRYSLGNIDEDNTSKVAVRHYYQRYNSPNNGAQSNGDSYYTPTHINSGSISMSGSNHTSHTSYSEGMLVASSTKLLGPQNSTTWQISDWNGSQMSNHTSLDFEATYDSSFNYKVCRPNTNEDTWLVAYVDSTQNLKVDTYVYSSGAISSTNSFIITSGVAGITIGSLTGSTAGLVLSYELDAKGYVLSLAIDSNRKVTDKGIALKHNDANNSVTLSSTFDTNKMVGLYNTSGGRVLARVLTINAYSTVPLEWLGVASASGSAGSSVKVTTDGVASGFSGLTAGSKYYYNTVAYNGTVSTTKSDYLIGTAVSTTEIKLNA